MDDDVRRDLNKVLLTWWAIIIIIIKNNFLRDCAEPVSHDEATEPQFMTDPVLWTRGHYIRQNKPWKQMKKLVA